MNKNDYDKRITEAIQDPCTSFWMKDALRTALMRDPVDAARDAETIASLLVSRCDSILADEAAYFLAQAYPAPGDLQEKTQ